jgi:hypothetical protein
MPCARSVDGGADMNLVDPDGTTALTLAILNGHFDAAVALLEKGANPNIPDRNGMTALYAAVDMNTIQTVWGRPMPLLEDAVDPVAMVRSLLAHRADPEPCSSSGRSSAAHEEHGRCLAQPGHDGA